MKRIFRNVLKGAGITVACLSLAVPVCAGTSTQSTTGYGTLKGYFSSSSAYTSVGKNNDNAYLTIQGEAQTSAGSTVSVGNMTSSRGQTYVSTGVYTPSGTYALFGAHGVQGGNTYGAYAVYTYTSC